MRRLSSVTIAFLVLSLLIPLVSGCSRTGDPVAAHMIVIDELMDHSQGLESGARYLAVDTTLMTSLDASGKARLMDWLRKFGLEVVAMSRAELEAKGMIRNLHFEDGLLIEISTRKASRNALTLDAQVWRSGAAGVAMKGLQVAYANGQWQIASPGNVRVA